MENVATGYCNQLLTTPTHSDNSSEDSKYRRDITNGYNRMYIVTSRGNTRRAAGRLSEVQC
eukprot:764594-Hanusia_phi.AAC.2